MNFTHLLAKTTIVFLVLIFVFSFESAEAKRSIRIRKVRAPAPKHVSISVRSNSGIYARKYDYGKPIPNYSTKGKFMGRGRNRRYFGNRKNGKREVGSRNYANGYRNWTPNRNRPGNRNNPRVDFTKRGPPNKFKEPYPFLKEPNFGANKQKRRIRPQRPNPVRRPPPKKLNEYDEDYFYTEEGKRAEGQYEFENKYRPKKKRRNPGEVEKIPKKPEPASKVTFYDEKPYFKTKSREPAVSYSSFIQHPSGSDDETDYYGDSDSYQYSQPVVKNKKKRVKKKTTASKKKNKDDDYYKPYAFETDKTESYPPYFNKDDYEISVKSTQKSKTATGYSVHHDDDFIPKKNIVFPQSKPQGSGLFSSVSTGSQYKDYRDSHSKQDNSQFSPSYSQPWSHTNVETTTRAVQYKTENGFQPQYIPSQYNYQSKDYSSLQKTKTTTTNTQQATYYSQPDNTYKNFAYSNNYVSNQVSTSNSNPQSNYNYNAYSNNLYQPSPTYQQPVVPSSTYNNDVLVQKSVPIYDNTETFYNFNNNAYVNSQSSKYSGVDKNSKYSNRLSDSLYRSTYGGEKTDSDSDFIKKHQNLYNNGLSGVPIQGDGYGKDNKDFKKDYDIGYGDFQFDENPGS